MADLPKWARADDIEETGGSLEDKLVDEASGESKPPAPDVEADQEDVATVAGASAVESPLASRALCLFQLLVVMTFILALVVIGTNCYVIYERFTELKARGVLLRVYGVVFCVFILFAELEWQRFLKYFGFLNYWPARGLFYVFVGLITWDQTDSDSSGSYETVEDIISFMMMGVGVIYFMLGLCCMRTVKEAERARLEEQGGGSNSGSFMGVGRTCC